VPPPPGLPLAALGLAIARATCHRRDSMLSALLITTADVLLGPGDDDRPKAAGGVADVADGGKGWDTATVDRRALVSHGDEGGPV
jgi:hypothetical protein